MKRKITIITLFLMFFLLLAIIQNSKQIEKMVENIRILQYGNPIDAETGVINNDYFGIYSDFSNERKTTEGINKAIRYANEHNIEYIKLAQGNYCIMATKSENGKKGIILCSNIEMDFNGSTIKAKENNATNYSIVTINGVDNVKLLNGVILGERNEHIYNENSTDEWGMGITIKSAQNIQVSEMHIADTTGDAIYISMESGKSNSRDISISNCNIYNCRRQGISVISGENILINENELHDINGTNPQSAIDLESNEEYEKIDNVRISNNRMYNFGNIYAIKVQKNIYNVNIDNNDIYSSIIVWDAKEKITIEDNTINNGNVVIYNSLSFRKQGRYIEKAIVSNNTISNGNINVNRVYNLKVNNNTLNDGNVTINSTNTILENNYVNCINNKMDYAYKIEPFTYKDIFYVYKNNNSCSNNIALNEIIEENEILKITTDKNKISVE